MKNSKPVQPLGDHKARKRFGQNFLIDHGIIRQIVRAIAAKPENNLVEIGPGKGAITEQLLEDCPNLHVIELDRDLIPMLTIQFERYEGFKIHQTDALKFDFAELASTDRPLRIVGNLPYNISTPLIFHLISYHTLISDMHFMLQKEVVERMAASPHEKAYGRLSVMVQYYCQVEPLFSVPPESFRPIPKVESAIVRLTPHKTLPNPAENLDLLQRLVNMAFQQRRKTLRNTLKKFIPDSIINTLEIDTSARPENVSVKEFVELSNQLNQLEIRMQT